MLIDILLTIDVFYPERIWGKRSRIVFLKQEIADARVYFIHGKDRSALPSNHLAFHINAASYHYPGEEEEDFKNFYDVPEISVMVCKIVMK